MRSTGQCVYLIREVGLREAKIIPTNFANQPEQDIRKISEWFRKGIFNECASDESTGNIMSIVTDIKDARVKIMELIQNAKESFYTTNIYPPQFWIVGNYLFNWDELGTNSDNGKRIINHFECVSFAELGHLESQQIEFCKCKNTIKAKKLNDLIFSIELKDDHAILASSKYLGERKIKLSVRKNNNNETEVYSGDPDELSYYKKYYDLVDNLNIKKMRIFISDIYGDENDWHNPPDNIIKEFVDEYNRGVPLRIGSIRNPEIARHYYGDMMIIDKKIALIYEPTRTEPDGETIGRLHIVKGNLIRKYLELFESDNIFWQKPEQFWRSCYICRA